MNNHRGSYTGSANIRLNLYNVQVDETTIPITLTYNSSGVKVNQEASWIGLGWDLTIGGSITESVFGSHFDENEYDRRNEPIFDFEGQGVAGTYGSYQTEVPFTHCGYNGPDGEEVNIFSYQVLGYSGKFYWDALTQDFKSFGEKKEDVFITGQRERVPYGNWASFTLRPGNGMTFTFERDVSILDIADGWGPGFGYPSGQFHLTRIELANGKQITFDYVGPFLVKKSVFRNSISGNTTDTHTVNFIGYTDTYTTQLSKITTPYETIHFQLAPRLDMAHEDDSGISGLNRLHQISILENLSGNLVKSFVFNTGYFTDELILDRLKLNARLKL
ncbi:MAG: hypothetical protein AAGA66_04245, partial [Bacteroidota bacterium]